MNFQDKVNILMVDDQPGKLLSYEVILAELGRESDQGDLRQGSLEIAEEQMLRSS